MNQEQAKTQITDEESILIQSHALIECLAKLGDLVEEGGPDGQLIEKLSYGQSAELLSKNNVPVFKGQGVVLAVFFLLLVVPWEWQKRESGELERIDFSAAKRSAEQLAKNLTCSYKKDRSILVHVRNAFAHGHLSWRNGMLVLKDVHPRDCHQKFECSFSMQDLGSIAQDLNTAVAAYVNNVIVPRGQMG